MEMLDVAIETVTDIVIDLDKVDLDELEFLLEDREVVDPMGFRWPTTDLPDVDPPGDLIEGFNQIELDLSVEETAERPPIPWDDDPDPDRILTLLPEWFLWLLTIGAMGVCGYFIWLDRDRK